MTDQSQNPPTEIPTVAEAETTAAPPSPPPIAVPPVEAVPPVVSITENVVAMQRQSGPGFLVRALWFVFFGTWLSGLSIIFAYFCCLTIIGLPLGFMVFNLLPVILTLRPRTDIQSVEVRDGVTYIRGGTVRQRPLWVRAIWFILVGWWFGAMYMSVAWFLCVILVTLPIGIWLFDRVGAVMTLLRY